MVNAYKLISGETGPWPYMVVGATGLPDLPFTLFANELRHSISPASIRVYVREILSLANWASTDPVSRRNRWSLLVSPEHVRQLVQEYLTVGAHCKVTGRPDTLGLTVTYVERGSGTRVNVRTLLAALKRFYEVLIANHLYPHPNPLLQAESAAIQESVRRAYREAVRSAEGRPPMPAISGVDPAFARLRFSQNYFRSIRDEWVPKSIDDPNFPHLIYAAGKAFGWKVRELCIARTLFESGARISEVCGLTAADWSVSDFLTRFASVDKGSHGRRTKFLMVSAATAKMYRMYFNESGCGPSRRPAEASSVGQLEALLRSDSQRLGSIPIFLTSRGTAMPPQLFRDHYWRPALRRAGIDADPHSARHWFVTNALRNIEAQSQDEGELRRRKAELIEYMGWRSGEQTMRTYEHLQRRERFFAQLSQIHREMEQRERKYLDPGSLPRMPAAEVQAKRDLAFLLGEDNNDDIARSCYTPPR
jgi:integrase